MAEWNRDDAGYNRWLKDHPQGFQANTYRPVGGHYFKIHRADCKLPDRSKPGSINPRTGNRYLKITGDTIAELKDWATKRLHLTLDRSNYCKRCVPYS
jgi:hypothetical protein